MTRFTITQTTTGVVLFDGEAADEREALDLMAQDAGYADYASIPAEIGGGDTMLIERPECEGAANKKGCVR